jgi:hypothetical protein
MCVAHNESGDVRCAEQGEVRSPVVKSCGQELLNDGHVVEQRGRGQTAFLQQVAPKLGDDPGLGAVRDGWLARPHNAFLAKHGQQSLQGFRIASANSLLPMAKSQKSIHNLAVQSLDSDVFPHQPPAEISDYDDLLSDRVVSIALIGYSGRIRVEVFIQRPLAEPFNRA